MNKDLFLTLNHACHALPDWFWSCVTITASASLVYALFALLLKRPPAHITALFIATGLGGLISQVLKEFFKLPRPPAVLPEGSFYLIGHKLELVSFPSGHTLTAFAIAALLIVGLRLRGIKLALCLALAALMGLSRIATGAHWPADVLGGAIIGSLLGWASWKLSAYLHINWRFLNTNTYKRTQIIVILATSISLIWYKSGYPLAIHWQYLCAAIGIVIASNSLILSLKSSNSH